MTTSPTLAHIAASDLTHHASTIDLGTVIRVNALSSGVIRVTPDHGTHAPEVTDVGQHDGDVFVGGGTQEWRALAGFTGQDGYDGAINHASETFSEGMAASILDQSGILDADASSDVADRAFRLACVTVDAEPTEHVHDDDFDNTPSGWAVVVLDGCGHDDTATCGAEGHAWCFTCEPTPASRCPWEADHEPEDDDDLHSGEVESDWADDLIAAARAAVATWGQLSRETRAVPLRHAEAIAHLSATLSDLPDKD